MAAMPYRSALQRLRSARFCGTHLVLWVLLWFAGSLSVAVASPLVAPKSVELVCTVGGGMKLVVHDDQGGEASGASHTLDCPLCQIGSAPPALPPVLQVPHAQPLSVAMQPIEAARIQALTSPPPPSRGPPAFA